MAADERTRHLRRLRRLHRSARGWTVRGGILLGAAAVFLPYQGLGLADAAWAAAAGGSVAIAAWRWIDLRVLMALPVPEAPSPELVAAKNQQRILGAVRSLPGGQAMIEEFDRRRYERRVRGLAVAGPWRRLDRASQTFAGLRSRVGGPVAAAVPEAAAAENALRELADRTAEVERTMRAVPDASARPLVTAHAELLAQFVAGVEAYERLVTAAAGFVAEDGRATPPSLAVTRLTEATDLLRGVSQGLSELRRATQPWPVSPPPQG